MKKLMVLFCLLLFCATAGAETNDSGVVLAWGGDAPELHAKVMIMYFNPKASMLAVKDVTREGIELFLSYRTQLDKGPYTLCIIKATSSSRQDLLQGSSTVGMNLVFVKNKDGHFARIADNQKELLGQIMRWDMKPKQSGQIL